VFGALAHENHQDLRVWFKKQRDYYRQIMVQFTSDMQEWLPRVIVSSPDAAIYSVVDVRNIAKPGFDARDFVMFCTSKGKVELDGKIYTALVAPMAGSYNIDSGAVNPGNTQVRIAYVESPERMKLLPEVFARLFIEYENQR